MNSEIFRTLTRWTARTEMLLNLELDKKNIGESHQLRRSLKSRTFAKSNAVFEAQIDFLIRGRFVDMGVGRPRKIESRDTNAELIPGGRKPKKWYSRTFWGRLNDLQGVLGYRMMESAIQAIKEPLKELQ